MKSWCDLSWNEKCSIYNGEVNEYKYLSGYSFEVKARIIEGKHNKLIKASRKEF